MTSKRVCILSEDLIPALQRKTILDLRGERQNFLTTRKECEEIVIHERVLVISRNQDFTKMTDEDFAFFQDLENRLKMFLGPGRGDPKAKKQKEQPTFGYPICIEGGSFYGLEVLRGCFTKQFKIKGGTFVDSFFIEGATFQQGFVVTEGNFETGLTIYRTKFCPTDGLSHGFTIEGGDFSYVSINDSTFKAGDEHRCSFLISGGFCKGDFYIQKNEFKSDVIIRKGIFASLFNIVNSTFEQNLMIKGGNFETSLNILGSKFEKELIFEAEDVNVFRIGSFFQSELEINHLIIQPHVFITQRIIIQKNAQITNLTLKQGITTSGSFYIYPIQIQTLTFDNFINEGRLEITGLEGKNDNQVKSSFRIIQSNLGNAVLRGVNFSSFSKIIILQAKLNNISTIQNHFPNTLKQAYSTTLEGTKQYQSPKEIAEIYNQLYLAMQKQGNRTIEMNFYAQFLHWQHKVAIKEKKVPAIISLTLHKWSTNFGQNWLWGFGWFILLSFCFYALYIQNLTCEKQTTDCLRQTQSFSFAKHYLQFINPIRKGKLIPWAELTASMVLIDLVWRIIVGYLTYQIITAFRRFGHK